MHPLNLQNPATAKTKKEPRHVPSSSAKMLPVIGATAAPRRFMIIRPVMIANRSSIAAVSTPKTKGWWLSL